MVCLEELGRRFKEIRTYYNFTQSDVAEKANLSQKTISHIEKGDNVGSIKLVSLISFYAKYINLNVLFSDHFDLLFGKNMTNEIHLDSVLEEKIKMAKEEMNDQMDDVKMNFNKFLNELLKLTNREKRE